MQLDAVVTDSSRLLLVAIMQQLMQMTTLKDLTALAGCQPLAPPWLLPLVESRLVKALPPLATKLMTCLLLNNSPRICQTSAGARLTEKLGHSSPNCYKACRVLVGCPPSPTRYPPPFQVSWPKPAT